MKIVLWAMALAAAWTFALFVISRTIGLHSTPGMWVGAVGLPGVVLANWTQAHVLHLFNRAIGYSLMFLINSVFYCTVLTGVASLKRSLS